MLDHGDFASAVQTLDAIIACEKPPVPVAQTLLAFKGQLLSSLGKKAEGRQALRAALEMAPQGESAPAIRAALEQVND
jgi:hypothetical protein